MHDRIQPRKVPMWEFFNEHPEAAGPVRLRRLEETGPNHRKVAHLFVEALKGRRRVVDIGCGTGLPGLYVAQHVRKVVCLDAASRMIAAAQENAVQLGVKNATFLVGGADGLPFANERFDGASLCGALESTDWQGVHRMMPEVWRVVEQGGRIAVLDQDWEQVMRTKPHLRARIWAQEERLTLSVVERSASPHLERHTRYLVDAETPSGRRLKDELGDTAPAPTNLGPRDLRPEDVLDAWYDEGAQFDAQTLAELVNAHGFRDIKVDTVPIWNESMLFLTASK